MRATFDITSSLKNNDSKVGGNAAPIVVTSIFGRHGLESYA